MQSMGTLVGRVALVAVSLAMAGGTPVAAQMASSPMRISGEITAIDTQKGFVKLRVQEEPVAQPQEPGAAVSAHPTEFAVDAQTRIVAEGAPTTLDHVEVGDQATVEYTTQEGRAVALSISIQEPPGATKPEGAEEPTATSPAW